MSSARADLELQVQKLQAEVAELRNRPQDSVEIDSRLKEQQELVDIQVGWLWSKHTFFVRKLFCEGNLLFIPI